MKVIKLERNQIRDALELVWTVFQEFEAPDYSKQGIEEFKNFISYNSIIEKFDKGELCFFGCLDNDNLTSVIVTRGTNHICMLFVKREYHKQGIGRSLFKAVENVCMRQNSMNKITVNSSPYAIEFYHRLGFIDIDKEQTINGIRFTPMVYHLK